MLTSKNAIAENKLLKLAPLLTQRYYDLINEFIKDDRKIYTRGYTGNLIFSVVFAVVFYTLFGRITWLVLGEHLTIGDIAMFAGATRQLRELLTSLAGQVSGAVEDTLFLSQRISALSYQPSALVSIFSALITQYPALVFFCAQFKALLQNPAFPGRVSNARLSDLHPPDNPCLPES